MTGCAHDPARHDRMLDVTGGDTAALGEARIALDRIASQETPDLASALAIACQRDRLAARNANIPAGLPAVNIAWPPLRGTACACPARVCQQESRSVSTAHAGPGPQTAPDAYTFADDAPRPAPTASSTSPTQWSRPIRIDVCSMFARMPRYGLALSGTCSAARMRATGQNGSSRHVLALYDSSSRRINEQSSGLLIRGFGVQVPGGAPVLTWVFINPGHLFVSGLSSCLLHVCSGARTQRSGACQKRAARRRIQGRAPRQQTVASGRRSGPSAESAGTWRPARDHQPARDRPQPGRYPGTAIYRQPGVRRRLGGAAGRDVRGTGVRHRPERSATRGRVPVVGGKS